VRPKQVIYWPKFARRGQEEEKKKNHLNFDAFKELFVKTAHITKTRRGYITLKEASCTQKLRHSSGYNTNIQFQ
jgi:hypothetical protein